MLEPIGEYDKAITEISRMLRFAANALALGDRSGATQIFNALPSLPKVIVERHVDLRDQFLRGLRRAAGHAGTDDQEVDNLDNLWREFTSLVDERFQALPSHAPRRPTEVDLLLVPQHLPQLTRMIDTIKGAELIWGVLLTDRDGGDQGVRRALDVTSQAWSVNEWWLGRNRTKAIMVGRCRDAAVERIAVWARDSQIPILTVTDLADKVEILRAAPTRVAGSQWSDEITGSMAGHVARSLTDCGGDGPASGLVSGLWASEEDPRTKVDREAMREFEGRHKGDRLVVIGNGPSLNRLDLGLLKNEFTIGVNGIFYAKDAMGFDPTFYVVEDTAVMADNLETIRAYEAGNKFFPSIYRDRVGEADNVTYFMMNRGFYSPGSPNFCIPRFSTDCSQQVFCGQSVTIINLQLAYYMGFAEVVLIGMDFSYVIPDDAEINGNLITSAGDDPNHFHPDYFGKGKVWKDPKLDRVLASYSLAKRMFEADGRRIINATAGGELHLFERHSYEALFS
jgi:hypothetical protein